MGTNYYKRRVLTQEEKAQLIRAVNEDRIESFSYRKEEGGEGEGGYDKVESDSDLFPPLEVHIAKVSCGWQVLFDHNDWKYYKGRESLEAFLKDGKGWLENEYGETVDPKVLWDAYKKREKEKSHAPHLRQFGRFKVVDGLEFDSDFC